MNNVDKEKVRNFYKNVDTVWPKYDKWHLVNQKEIVKFIHRLNLNQNCNILNAGSGGNNYGLDIDMHHVDIAENKICKFKHYTVGDIEKMPFTNEYFDISLCVGSVINYCDAFAAIREISRVTKHKGLLILEFENSFSFEFKNTDAFKSNASIITTNYFNKPHTMWVYSLEYIISILNNYNFIIDKIYTYHILSSIIYYYTKNENAAAKYAVFDIILRYIPIIYKYSGNVILKCYKK